MKLLTSFAVVCMLMSSTAFAQSDDIEGTWVHNESSPDGSSKQQNWLEFSNGVYRLRVLGQTSNPPSSTAMTCTGRYRYNGDVVSLAPRQCQICGGGNCFPPPTPPTNYSFTLTWQDDNNFVDDSGAAYHRH